MVRGENGEESKCRWLLFTIHLSQFTLHQGIDFPHRHERGVASIPRGMSHSASRVVVIRAEPIELCQLLKFAGLAATGGEAKSVIEAGQVTLNGAVETQRGKKVRGGDRVTCGAETLVVQVGLSK